MHRFVTFVMVLVAVSLAGAGIATLTGTPAAAQEQQSQPENEAREPSTGSDEDSSTGHADPDDPDKPIEGGSAKANSPLDLLMQNGIPELAEQRARLRDDLYALLATAGDEKEAKRIAGTIERVWLTAGSDTIGVLMRRAGRALKTKDHKLAMELLDNVVELAPDYAEGWNRRAYVHYSMKNFRAAVGDLRRTLALDKNHYKALDGLSSIFQQIGDEAKALTVLKQLREIHPFWPEIDQAIEKLGRKTEGRGI